jgi:death-on-curing family protein
MYWMPTVKAVEEVHLGLVAMFAAEEDPVSPAGIRSQSLLESAVNRPHTGSGTSDKYDTLYRKLAALFHSLTKNHPFHNGNKRTALVTLLTALHRNNRRLKPEVTDDQLFDFVLSVTADNFPSSEEKLDADGVVEEISKWVKDQTVPIEHRPGGMKTLSFIEKCKQAGVKYKEGKGGSHILQSGLGVKISKSTRQLDGAVVRQYLKRLNLNEVAGIGIDEFRDGTSGEREQIYRFMATLKRLAKT